MKKDRIQRQLTGKKQSKNPYIEKYIDDLYKTIYWAVEEGHARDKDIVKQILTLKKEFVMRYSPKHIIDFGIGDIVEVDYGYHLPGEIMGRNVIAIVCKIHNEDMVYIVPITKVREDITSYSYLFMKSGEANYACKNGIVLLDKGKFMRAERVNKVIGKTTQKFFEKVSNQLATTFDFTGGLTSS